MLVIDVKLEDSFDERTNEFVVSKSFRVELEHSLFSLSKWEGLWEKAFLTTKDKTTEETLSYVRFMVLNDELPPEAFSELAVSHLAEVNEYIGAKMTATTIAQDETLSRSREIITSEVIYYWMVSMSIPFECQHWHLNRLIMLVNVINAKNKPAKKMTPSQRSKLNKQRLNQHNTRG